MTAPGQRLTGMSKQAMRTDAPGKRNAMKRDRTPTARTDVRELQQATPAMSLCLGRLSLGDAGELFVVIDGRPPQPARLVARLDRGELLKPENSGRQVLLAIDPAAPQHPIVLDLIEQPFADLLSRGRVPADGSQREAYVDGKRVVIEGRSEVVLRCGEGQIVLRSDGKILIKGTHLVSRSTGINKIKGGAVQIN